MKINQTIRILLSVVGGLVGCGYGYLVTFLSIAFGGAGHGTVVPFFIVGAPFGFASAFWAIIGAMLPFLHNPRLSQFVVRAVYFNYAIGLISAMAFGDGSDKIFDYPLYSLAIFGIYAVGQIVVWALIWRNERKQNSIGKSPLP